MRYNEQCNENRNPPQAMQIALGYLRQLDALVRQLAVGFA
jgi:hypothetical protein